MKIKSIDNDIECLCNEIYYLNTIKKEVDNLISLGQSNTNIRFLSKMKYDDLFRKALLDEQLLYYIVKPEIGQYIDGYMG